jgi:hypothetical protein
MSKQEVLPDGPIQIVGHSERLPVVYSEMWDTVTKH